MSQLDLIVRNADIATATESFRGDIGIKDGRIAVLGQTSLSAERVDRCAGLPGHAGRRRRPLPSRPADERRLGAWPTTSTPARALRPAAARPP